MKLNCVLPVSKDRKGNPLGLPNSPALKSLIKFCIEEAERDPREEVQDARRGVE